MTGSQEDEAVLDYSYDGMSSKPICEGRDITDSRVTTCGSRRCMTCMHVVVGDNFTCNINGRKYKVTESSSILDCNVVYLISCKKCSVQCVGETSQVL